MPPVSALIAERLQATLEPSVAAAVIALLVGILLGVFAAPELLADLLRRGAAQSAAECVGWLREVLNWASAGRVKETDDEPRPNCHPPRTRPAR